MPHRGGDGGYSSSLQGRLLFSWWLDPKLMMREAIHEKAGPGSLLSCSSSGVGKYFPLLLQPNVRSADYSRGSQESCGSSPYLETWHLKLLLGLHHSFPSHPNCPAVPLRSIPQNRSGQAVRTSGKRKRQETGKPGFQSTSVTAPPKGRISLRQVLYMVF